MHRSFASLCQLWPDDLLSSSQLQDAYFVWTHGIEWQKCCSHRR